MPDRELVPPTPGEAPDQPDVNQLVEAERGLGTQGIRRTWQASNSALTVLTSDANGVRISRDAGATPPAQVVVDGTTAGGGLAGTYPNPTLAPSAQDVLMPPGAIVPFAGAAVPSGWLFCDGSVQSAAAYPRLFAAIGTLYGSGGAGTFRLPDLQGRVVVCASGPHPHASTGGAELSASQLLHTHPGSHNHPQTQHQHLVNAHEHDLNNHAHTLQNHTHGQNGHAHDINHDHANAVGAAAASPTATNAILNGTGASTTVPAANHVHPVDLPALGVVSSGGPSNPDTQGPSTPNTSGNSGNTSTLAAANTNLSAVVNTGDASPVPAAAYGGATIPPLPPYMAINMIIRAV